MSDQLTRIERKIDRFMVNRAIHRVFILAMLGGLTCWNIWCHSDRITRTELQAELRELRRIIAMLKEDPKNFKKIDAQFKAIKEYEDAKNN